MVIRVNYEKRVILITTQNSFLVKLEKYYFDLFCLSLYRMVGSKYSPDNYETLKRSIGAKIKNPEMLRSVPDHLKIKKVCGNAVKKLPFAVRYVPD